MVKERIEAISEGISTGAKQITGKRFASDYSQQIEDSIWFMPGNETRKMKQASVCYFFLSFVLVFFCVCHFIFKMSGEHIEWGIPFIVSFISASFLAP